MKKFLVFLFILVIFVSVVNAEACTWTAGGGDEDWHVGANWDCGHEPTGVDWVFLNSSVAAINQPVIYDNATVVNITIVGGSTLTIDATSESAGDLYLKFNDTAVSNYLNLGFPNWAAQDGNLIAIGDANNRVVITTVSDNPTYHWYGCFQNISSSWNLTWTHINEYAGGTACYFRNIWNWKNVEWTESNSLIDLYSSASDVNTFQNVTFETAKRQYLYYMKETYANGYGSIFENSNLGRIVFRGTNIEGNNSCFKEPVHLMGNNLNSTLVSKNHCGQANNYQMYITSLFNYSSIYLPRIPYKISLRPKEWQPTKEDTVVLNSSTSGYGNLEIDQLTEMGNFTIEAGMDVTVLDTLVIYDNLDVYGTINISTGGKIIMNGTLDGDSEINIYSGGRFRMEKGGNLTNGLNDSANYVFYAQSGSSVDLRDSFISKAGWEYANYHHGVDLVGATVHMENMTIVGDYMGVYLNNIDNSNFTGNNITSTESFSLWAYNGSDNNNFTNNNIYSYYNFSVYIATGSDYNNFTNENWTSIQNYPIRFEGTGQRFKDITMNGRYGIYIRDDEGNNTFNNCSITAERTGVYVYYTLDDDKGEVTFQNSTINANTDQSTYKDFYADLNGGNITFVNTTLNESNLFWDTNAFTNLIMKYYTKVNITNSTGSQIENATITMKNKFTFNEFIENTSSSGITNWQPTTSYVQNYTTGTENKTYYDKHTITAVKTGYITNSTSWNVTKNKNAIVHIYLFPGGSPPAEGTTCNVFINANENTFQDFKNYTIRIKVGKEETSYSYIRICHN